LVLALLVSPAVPLFADAEPTSPEPLEGVANECLPAPEVSPEAGQVVQPEPLFLSSQCTCVSCDGLPNGHAYCQNLCQGCGFSGGGCLRDLGTVCDDDSQAKFCFCF
jgi:hypothetical protein